eukprot:12424115-Karenia_brevis.AAC.2
MMMMMMMMLTTTTSLMIATLTMSISTRTIKMMKVVPDSGALGAGEVGDADWDVSKIWVMELEHSNVNSQYSNDQA